MGTPSTHLPPLPLPSLPVPRTQAAAGADCPSKAPADGFHSQQAHARRRGGLAVGSHSPSQQSGRGALQSLPAQREYLHTQRGYLHPQGPEPERVPECFTLPPTLHHRDVTVMNGTMQLLHARQGAAIMDTTAMGEGSDVCERMRQPRAGAAADLGDFGSMSRFLLRPEPPPRIVPHSPALPGGLCCGRRHAQSVCSKGRCCSRPNRGAIPTPFEVCSPAHNRPGGFVPNNAA